MELSFHSPSTINLWLRGLKSCTSSGAKSFSNHSTWCVPSLQETLDRCGLLANTFFTFSSKCTGREGILLPAAPAASCPARLWSVSPTGKCRVCLAGLDYIFLLKSSFEMGRGKFCFCRNFIWGPWCHVLWLTALCHLSQLFLCLLCWTSLVSSVQTCMPPASRMGCVSQLIWAFHPESLSRHDTHTHHFTGCSGNCYSSRSIPHQQFLQLFENYLRFTYYLFCPPLK